MFMDKWKAKQSFTEPEMKELLDLAITIYEMASEDKNIEKMKQYATYIRNFQKMLGMQVPMHKLGHHVHAASFQR